MTDAFDLGSTYLAIGDDGVATPIEITPAFWVELTSGQRRLPGRWLMGAGPARESPPNWDLHPEGECLIVLLSGSIDVIQETDGGDRTVELRQPGDSCFTPRGVWHRQIVHAPSERVFLVAGSSTQMRPA